MNQTNPEIDQGDYRVHPKSTGSLEDVFNLGTRHKLVFKCNGSEESPIDSRPYLHVFCAKERFLFPSYRVPKYYSVFVCLSPTSREPSMVESEGELDQEKIDRLENYLTNLDLLNFAV